MRADPRDESGAALIEAALIMPVLLLLVFGTMEASLYYWRLGLAAKAVQLGLRTAIVSDSVAAGPGLTPAESADYWDDQPLGLPCRPRGTGTSACPSFVVRCLAPAGCSCRGTGCRFGFDRSKLTPILTRMQSLLEDLRPENVEITYATNDLGYVGRPVPIPVDVTVSLVGLTYRVAVLGSVFGRDLPVSASATLPAESLRSVEAAEAACGHVAGLGANGC